MSSQAGGRIRIAAFGAHAGDMEITAGGAILKYAAGGGKVLIAHALEPSGKWARPPHLTVEQYSEQRYNQAFEVGKALGVEVKFLGYKEGQPFDIEEMKLRVCDIIREFKPDIVLTHWKGSYHPDHVLTFLNVMEGINYAQSEELKRNEPSHRLKGLFFPENWEDPQGFQPDFYLDIGDQFETYLNAIRIYDFTSGVYSGFNYIDYYASLCRLRGMEAGYKYAQAFMVPNEWAARRQKGEFLPM